jgi:tRNA(Ile)-lysidine synthase
MLDKFLTFFEPQDKILAAVSGGLDSMVMVQMLHESGFSFGIAHVNFTLRGNESDADQEFVRQWAEQRDVIFHTISFDTHTVIEQSNESLQMVARRLRYEWFEQLVEEGNYTKLALAHHLDDSLESSIFALIKGGGIAALAGIAPFRGKIVRPLSYASRDEIRDFAVKNDIAWREDSSNQRTDYSRNFIRHEIIPLAKRINPSIQKTYQSTRERLEGTAELLKYLVQQIQEKYCSSNRDEYTVKLDWIKIYPAPWLLLHEILRFTGLRYEQSRQLYDSIDETGKRFLTASYEVFIDRGQLIVVSAGKYPVEQTRVDYREADVHCGVWKLRCKKTMDKDIRRNAALAQLDAEKLHFPLILRAWKQGDRFLPLGMTGMKKVSDFLIDEKVPLPEKQEILVLCSGDEICWVVGMRIDDRFKLSAETQKVFEIEAAKV